MRGWRYTCDIKQHFIESDNPDDFYDDEKFLPSRDAIVAEIKASRDYRAGTDSMLIFIVGELEESYDVDEFNEALDRLYDWADLNRVWLGLR